MIKITFPDGSIKEYEKNVTAADIAFRISPNLRKKAVCAKINDEMVDLNRAITEDCTIVLVTKDMPEAFDVLNHSTAHLLAQAIKRLYPEAKFGIGPSIEEGFYYDIDLGDKVLSLDDLPKIEKAMSNICSEGFDIVRREVSKSEAMEIFANEPYKVDLISNLEDGTITIYEQGDFVDLCRGVHLLNTKEIKFFKLLSVAGAYWKGDSKNKQLTRVYGTSWYSDADLKSHLANLEERKKRDHRKIGKELGLFMMSNYGPGLPFWLPNGYVLRRNLEDYWLKYHKENGYKVIETPIMLSKELWETSGHWDHYKEDMYITNVDENEFAIKPMNCPGAILCYKNDIHSYKELPLRFAELGHVHRHEASGALNGLFRVRTFTQDDAHTLLTEDQIELEIENILKIYDHIYSIFNLDYKIELSTRPVDNYIGDIAVWDKAEAALTRACLATKHDFKVNPGDGAFYGPKLDFKLRDSMNRIWQCGTIQLDMQLPGRFECTYIAEDGSKKTPVMIHRACFGSLERFIAIITENFAGAFPTWLTPVQVKVIPVNLGLHKDYCDSLVNAFNKADLRVETDYREEKLGYKIREAQTKKIPYQLVVGDNEVNTNTVTYRRYGSEKQVNVSVEEFIKMIEEEIDSMSTLQ